MKRKMKIVFAYLSASYQRFLLLLFLFFVGRNRGYLNSLFLSLSLSFIYSNHPEFVGDTRRFYASKIRRIFLLLFFLFFYLAGQGLTVNEEISEETSSLLEENRFPFEDSDNSLPLLYLTLSLSLSLSLSFSLPFSFFLFFLSLFFFFFTSNVQRLLKCPIHAWHATLIFAKLSYVACIQRMHNW